MKKVAERVCMEMDVLETGNYDALPEPLRWSMHGRPGTGKTHVIKIIKEELFENRSKRNIGVEVQIVALQAVKADLFAGDTIHHAFHFPVFGNVSKPTGDKGAMKTMKAILQLRWLIIDEISMVSARLPADVDMKHCDYARAVDPFLKDANKNTRPLAGINLLCSGDSWQLPPPDGGLLGDIPC